MTAEVDEARERLVADFKRVIRDAEALLKATSDQTGEAIEAVRERARETLLDARAQLEELEGDLIQRTRAAARATNDLVHDRPWQAVGVASAVAFLLGMLSGRR